MTERYRKNADKVPVFETDADVVRTVALVVLYTLGILAAVAGLILVFTHPGAAPGPTPFLITGPTLGDQS
jgi:uncharacterized membrane protein